MRNIVLYLFLASLNFETWKPFQMGDKMSLAKLLGWIYFLMMVPHFLADVRTSLRGPVLRPLWLFFGLFTVMNVLYSPGRHLVTWDWVSVFQNTLLFWFLVIHAQKDRLVLENGMLSFALGAAAQTGMFLADIGLEEVQGRISIFEDNANTVGLRIGAGIVILLLAIAQNRFKLGKWRYLLLLPLPSMLQFMVATGSRVSLIAFVLALVTGVGLFKTKRPLGKIVVLAGGAIVAFAIWLSVSASETLSNRLLSTFNDRDFAGRDEIWGNLLPLVAKHPFVGSGQTGYDRFCELTFGYIVSPHNVLLEVLCYTGFVGLSLYLWFLWRVFQSGWQSYRAEGWLLPLVLWCPIVGCLLSGQVLVWKFVWCILAYNVGRPMPKPKLRVRRSATMLPQPKPVISLAVTRQPKTTERAAPAT